jgi:cold shock CspA family protein
VTGTIQVLNPRGFGFIECEDGVQRFFNARELRRVTFSQLAIGMRVQCKPAPARKRTEQPEARFVEAACTL